MGKEVQCSASASLVRESEILIQNGVSKCSNETKKWLSSLLNVQSNPTSISSKIQRVPPIIRDIKANDKCYDPLVVSIGPYHHGKTELELMEKHKCKMASNYANNDQQMLDKLYTKVMDVAKDARDFYEDDDKGTVAKFKDDDFTRMMFLDGCFVLQFIYCFTNKDEHNDLGMKNNIAMCVERDLLLLENQIPFLVLKELMSLRPEFWDWKKLFNDFIKNIFEPPQKDQKKETRKNEQARQQEELILQFEDEPAFLLDYARKQLIGENTSGNPQTNGSWSSYRSAKELKTVGIHFNPSKTHLFTDVKFEYTLWIGQLSLPPITIDDSTKSTLLNMIAYEACPDSPNDFGVTSYICFLDSLIDHAEDVKELRSKGILLNFLGSDQQVADVFNQIADNLVPSPYAYADIKRKIEDHYRNNIKIWLAEWLHTHFTSPWTILAFIGAIFALVLSVIQTYKAIYPPK